MHYKVLDLEGVFLQIHTFADFEFLTNKREKRMSLCQASELGLGELVLLITPYPIAYLQYTEAICRIFIYFFDFQLPFLVSVLFTVLVNSYKMLFFFVTC